MIFSFKTTLNGCSSGRCCPEFSNLSQQTFQRCFNVIFWLIWRHDVGQGQINVETTLCISSFQFAMPNNVESTLRISTLMWTTLNNVETTLSFSTSSFIKLINVETTLWKWPFQKKKKKKSFQTSTLNTKFLFTLLSVLRGIWWRLLAKPQKLRSCKKLRCKNLI